MAARKPKKNILGRLRKKNSRELACECDHTRGELKNTRACDKSTQRAPADTVRRSHDLLLLLRNAPQAAPDLRQCLAGRAVGAGDVR